MPPRRKRPDVKLALRLVAVGIVVLASLLYAGAVQIGTRDNEIASYAVGENAVRLVERLDDVSAALAAYRRPVTATVERSSAQSIEAALRAQADTTRAATLDGDAIRNRSQLIVPVTGAA